ncbi:MULTISPECIES: MBL fold metallo-hydrolase [unclassified Nocardioides]|uniref:MBL fold metallo-hydrolase n=1 Tax=unclassified Nocardioides TaxID=2615069 RepID=UPI0009EF8116|nr:MULTISPECIES: MBL fold metallo-hydrolase [unclassified Nocardioides]GAW49949.1 beta-lactamase domain-containing protein [Nocardioides sp. PD653-B2]GAW55958.1 beta-lactamase domain-containing protein [Nocardioides sp. PD653]
MAFTEVADRIWVARYDWFDVNVTLVGGDRGLLVVDTHASGLAARGVIDDVRRLGVGEIVGIVNTHEHFDHTFGNAEFRAAYGEVPIHAHEIAAERTVSAGERVKGLYDAEPHDPHRDEVRATEIVAADHTFSSAVALDLGDRMVELVHPGRGHTSGDLVVRVPDADVMLAGDLVEESTLRQAVPGFGDDCYPMDWPLSLDIVLGLTTNASVVVPGHGAPVDRDFVEEQRNAIGIVAETIRDLAGRGVPEGQALEAADWPYPREELAAAVRRGYLHLPRSQKRLPLV